MSKEMYTKPWGGHNLCGCCDGSMGVWYCLFSSFCYVPMLQNTYKIPNRVTWIPAVGWVLTVLSAFMWGLFVVTMSMFWWFDVHFPEDQRAQAVERLLANVPKDEKAKLMKDEESLMYALFSVKYESLTTINDATTRTVVFLLSAVAALARCHIQKTRFVDQPFREGCCKSCCIAFCCTCCSVAQQMKFLNDETIVLASEGENKPTIPAQDATMV